METFNEYINRHQTIEAEVFNLLSEYSSDDEPIEKGDSSSVFDFNLPKGISKLGYEAETRIEIKYRMAYLVISRIVKMFDLIKPPRLIVVIYEGNDFKEIYKKNIGDRNIEILFFDEFKEQVRKIKSENIKKTDAYPEDVKKTLKKRIKENRLSIFIGAGVSASAGVPTWQNLLECLCVKNGIPKMDSDIDELTKARFIIEEKYKKNGIITESFYEDMKDCLYKNIRNSNLLSSISKLVEKYTVESIITYNYDNLLEVEINKGKKNCESIYDKTRTFDLPVYHVHGYIPNNPKSTFDHSEIVLGESEYHKIYQEAYNWGNVEQLHALCRNTCLFIGLSMKDPNLRRLIDISLEGSDVEPIHFVFLRRIEYNVPFMEKTMRSFGINCVWYDEFSDLPNLLDDLCK